jgi:hypothetical protein
MALSKVDGLPTLPGSVTMSEETDGMYIAYGDYVKGTNTKWSRGPNEVVAYLKEWKPGEFIVATKTEEELDVVDPESKGKTVAEMPVEFVAEDHGGNIGGGSFWDAMDVKPPKPPVVVEEK